jgi:hypothetical protein
MKTLDPVRIMRVTTILHVVAAVTGGLIGMVRSAPMFISLVSAHGAFFSLFSSTAEVTGVTIVVRMLPSRMLPTAQALLGLTRVFFFGIAPTYGSLMYAAGGFPLPFLFSASFGIFSATVMYFVFGLVPKPPAKHAGTITACRLLQVPSACALVGISLTLTLQPSMEPLLPLLLACPPYNLDITAMGALSSVGPYSYVIFTATIGVWLPRLLPNNVQFVMGYLLFAAGFTFKGIWDGPFPAVGMYVVGSLFLMMGSVCAVMVQPVIYLRLMHKHTGLKKKDLAGALLSTSLAFNHALLCITPFLMDDLFSHHDWQFMTRLCTCIVLVMLVPFGAYILWDLHGVPLDVP